MQPEQPDIKSVAPPAPSELPSPAQYPQVPPAGPPVPATGYHVPRPTAPAPRARSLRLAAAVVVAGLGLNIVLDLADTVLTPWATGEALRGALAADDPLFLAATGVTLLQLGAVVATAAAFITWLFLARKNLEVWGIFGLGWSPGWAIGVWFIPVANLVLVPLVVSTVARGSRTAPSDGDAPTGGSVLVWCWWLTYICGGLTANMFVRKDFAVTDSTSYIAGYNAANTTLSIVAAVLAIVLVRRITGQQERRQAALDQPWQQAMFAQA